jgi:uncharacterized protein with FMN-binding domain
MHPMKRAPIVLSATVAGLAATLGFHTQSPAASATAVATTTTAQAAPSTSTSTGSSSSAGTTASTSTKTATSAVEANQYGNVQLKVTIKAGKITKIEAVQIPNSDPKSAEINASAEPLLQQSALSAQSANIDAVSGATYTSNSYKAALQSALDKANFSASSASAS